MFRGYVDHPPAYALDAIPTSRGWVDAKTGELLVGTPFINPALYTKKEESPEVEAVKESVPPVEPLKEEPTAKLNQDDKDEDKLIVIEDKPKRGRKPNQK